MVRHFWNTQEMIFGTNSKDYYMLLTWYYYLNYRIYMYYERKRDSIPGFFSFSATVVLVSLNIFSAVGLCGFLSTYINSLIFSMSKYSILVLYLLIGLFNYFTLYRGNHYKEVFSGFERASEKYKDWEKTVPIYIISSIVLLLIVLAIADYRHDGHF